MARRNEMLAEFRKKISAREAKIVRERKEIQRKLKRLSSDLKPMVAKWERVVLQRATDFNEMLEYARDHNYSTGKKGGSSLTVNGVNSAVYDNGNLTFVFEFEEVLDEQRRDTIRFRVGCEYGEPPRVEASISRDEEGRDLLGFSLPHFDSVLDLDEDGERNHSEDEVAFLLSHAQVLKNPSTWNRAEKAIVRAMKYHLQEIARCPEDQ